MTQTVTKTRVLVECALMIAVGYILALLPPIFSMPYGGSVTYFTMLPFMLVSFRHGVKWGLLTGFVNGVLQMALGMSAPPANTALAFGGMVMLDYILAFMVLGVAGAFMKYRLKGVILGSVVACLGRLLFSFLSGILLWSSYQEYYDWAVGMPVWLYSLVYNGSYMLPEMILTTGAAVLLYRFVPQLFLKKA